MAFTPVPENSTIDPSGSRIIARYLMLQGSTPVYIDKDGKRWLDRLWAIDARAHLNHIQRLSIACPFVPIHEHQAQLMAVESDPLLRQITFVELPWTASRLRAILQLPSMCSSLWRAIRANDIVHMGIAGWPYPLGWLGWPIAKLQSKATIVNVESAPWRSDSESPSRLKRLQCWIYESLGRGIVRRADMRFFTTAQYRLTLGSSDNARDIVVEATWIPQNQVIDAEALEMLLEYRANDSAGPLRIGFFGRITAEKGIYILTGALRATSRLVNVSIDIFGDGPDLVALRETIASDACLDRARLCGMVDYGPELFERLRDYDYLIVPSLGDEQPRIVYDAYSQGIPVLSSDTTGLRQCVREGETGLFFGKGDTAGLTALFSRIDSESGRNARPAMARRCAAVARTMTHAAMHEKRASVIANWLTA